MPAASSLLPHSLLFGLKKKSAFPRVNLCLRLVVIKATGEISCLRDPPLDPFCCATRPSAKWGCPSGSPLLIRETKPQEQNGAEFQTPCWSVEMGQGRGGGCVGFASSSQEFKICITPVRMHSCVTRFPSLKRSLWHFKMGLFVNFPSVPIQERHRNWIPILSLITEAVIKLSWQVEGKKGGRKTNHLSINWKTPSHAAGKEPVTLVVDLSFLHFH